MFDYDIAFKIEIFIILGIIIAQFVIFIKCIQNLAIFKKVFPPTRDYAINPIEINETITYQIQVNENHSPTFSKIVEGVNLFIANNRGEVSDFDGITSIVERTIDIQETKIFSNQSLPLYLGLLGTMAGIVVGLGNMFIQVSTVSSKDINIQGLLPCVSVAMVASFLGLFFTILISGWLYPKAKAKVYSQKNEFYIFLQAQLFPNINLKLTKTVDLFHKNIHLFNNKFSINLDKMSSIYESHSDNLKSQQEIMQSLETIDIAKIAKYNISVFKEMENSIQKISHFSKYFELIEQMIQSTQSLSQELNSLVSRCSGVETIGIGIASRVEKVDDIVQFLANYFREIENRKASLTGVLSQFDETISHELKLRKESSDKIFDALCSHIETRSANFKQYVTDLDESTKQLFKSFQCDSNFAINSLRDDIKSTLSYYDESITKELREVKDVNNKTYDEVCSDIIKRQSKFNQVIVGIDDSINTALNSLKDHSEKVIHNIRTDINAQEDALIKSLEANKIGIGQLTHLEKLNILVSLKDSVDQITSNIASPKIDVQIPESDKIDILNKIDNILAARNNGDADATKILDLLLKISTATNEIKDNTKQKVSRSPIRRIFSIFSSNAQAGTE